MKLYFDATSKHFDYLISGETINDIDLSPIPTDTKITPLPKQLRDAGIRAVRRDEQGELHVTLQQMVTGSRYGKPAHWRANSAPVDSTEYDPDECYVVPTGLADVHDYELVWVDDWQGKGWTAVKIRDEGIAA